MLKRLFHIAFVLLLLCACGSREAQRMLDRAEAVMSDNPGQAITVLDSIGDDGLSRSQRMRRLLLLTNAQNKCDTVFRSDSIQRLLVDYYESHGTANERMLAHYLLGRAYYEMGEVPAALESFLDAISYADTTSQSCDYSLLSRVHGQTARLFLEQEAPNNALDEIEKVNKYAQLSKDTLMLLVNEGVRANAYTMLGNEDSLISIYMRVHQKWKDYGNDAYAAMVQAPAIVYLLNKGKIKRAQELLTEYEKNSGMVTNGNVVDGQEIYYYVKGRYYAEVGDIDSAFIFFRKALKKCRKADEQAIISYHLANLFQETGNKDSAFLYWRKSYNELDSAHIKMGTERLQRLKANYDYGFQKRIAEQKKKDSIRNRNVAALLGLLFLLSLIAIHAIILHVKRYKEKTRERENQLQQKLAELEDLAMSKNMAERESSLMESEIRARFAGLLNKKEHPKPSYSDWKELRSFVAEKAPQFYELVNASNLTSDEVDICILIRLHFLPAQIHCFTGLTVAHISVIRKRLLHKVFHTSNGGAREFDEKLRNL